ncbi:hypothetical protein [Reticulibacter mediterranei]|uniref:hypothetical protein n=1 Tax=Reticulibacter mediterranei TaxID=2778369 RepID=UPI001C694247|nr:hypothetical protein [Reticulibacter mediterranei]
MGYQQIQRTVTLVELLAILSEWTCEGAVLITLEKDANGNPTRAVLVDHGQQRRAEYTVGLVSEPPEPYISPEEHMRQETIDQAYALVDEEPDICIETFYESDCHRISCWRVTILSLNWQPTLPYGYCYTAHQLLMIVEEALAIYRRIVGSSSDRTTTAMYCDHEKMSSMHQRAGTPYVHLRIRCTQCGEITEDVASQSDAAAFSAQNGDGTVRSLRDGKCFQCSMPLPPILERPSAQHRPLLPPPARPRPQPPRCRFRLKWW